jgi:molybdopterin/thiamine biosynthesis adenylyltransferase
MEGILSRLKDAPWLKYKAPYVLVAGAGGIGSWTALLLARAGLAPFIADFDTIEVHNMGGQLFSSNQIGKKKVLAVQDTIKSFCDKDVVVFEDKVNSNFEHINNLIIAAFDNMKARKELFNLWVKDYKDDKDALFIDGRLTAEQLQIFCVRPKDIEEYKKYLFDDSEVEEAPCTFKQTSHSAAMIAAHITGFMTNHLSNLVLEEEVRAVPFKWEYFIPLDLLNP